MNKEISINSFALPLHNSDSNRLHGDHSMRSQIFLLKISISCINVLLVNLAMCA